MVNVNTNFEQAADNARQVIPRIKHRNLSAHFGESAVFPMFTNDLLGDPILIALTFQEG